MAWDYPVFIIAMFIVAMGVAVWLMRSGPKKHPPGFTCSLCGRKHQAITAKEWRYCPFCGSPRDAKTMAQLPTQRRSVVDLDSQN